MPEESHGARGKVGSEITDTSERFGDVSHHVRPVRGQVMAHAAAVKVIRVL